MRLVRRALAALALAALLALPLGATAALADAHAPTNGGSANGAGQSGNCTGDMASRPASCHNGNGAGN
jgi:hypothetical protein